MTTATIQQQVQAGIDARIGQPIINAARPLAIGYRTMLGFDGTSIDDAVEQAFTPTGPSREVIRARIEFRRAHPGQLHPSGAGHRDTVPSMAAGRVAA